MSITFSFEDNGHIIQIDEDDPAHGMRQEPDWFWSTLPEKVRVALAKAAPKVVTPWEHSENHSWRNKESSLNPAADVYLTERGWRSVWRPEPFPTREEAMAFEDNVLRGKGYVLDG